MVVFSEKVGIAGNEAVRTSLLEAAQNCDVSNSVGNFLEEALVNAPGHDADDSPDFKAESSAMSVRSNRADFESICALAHRIRKHSAAMLAVSDDVFARVTNPGSCPFDDVRYPNCAAVNWVEHAAESTGPASASDVDAGLGAFPLSDFQ